MKTLRARVREGSFVTDQTPHESVVLPMGVVAVRATQKRVETMLGVGERRVCDVDAERTKLGRANRDQERFNGLFTSRKVGKTLVDQLRARKAVHRERLYRAHDGSPVGTTYRR